MPTVTRELSIAYGSVTVGGLSDVYLLDGPHALTEGYETATLSCNVVCVGSTAVAFATNCTALEDAFRTPRQNLTVTLSGQTLKSWSHSGNTGFYANPSIQKLGDIMSTGRSRRYAITIAVNRPADLSGQIGRLNSSSSLIIASDNKRTITMSGRYTATGGGTALANYVTGISAFQASIISLFAVGVTFEKTSETRTIDDANKFCDYSRTLSEINASDQIAGVTNHQLTLSRSYTSPGDSYQMGGSARRLITIAASFRGGVDFGTNARQKWDSTIVPWIVGKVSSVFGLGGSVIVDHVVTVPVRYGEPMTGSLTFIALNGSNTVEFSWMLDQRTNGGKAILPAWDVDQHSAYVFTGPELVERTLTTRTVMVSGPLLVPDGPMFMDKLLPHELLPEDDSWVSLTTNASEHPIERGLPGGASLKFIERNTSQQQQYVTLAKGTQINPSILGANLQFL